MHFYIQRSKKTPRYWLLIMKDKANNIAIFGSYNNYKAAKCDFLNDNVKFYGYSEDYIDAKLLCNWGINGKYSKELI